MDRGVVSMVVSKLRDSMVVNNLLFVDGILIIYLAAQL